MRSVGYEPSTKVANTDRVWTKGLWKGIPWDQIVAGEREGNYFFDNFDNLAETNEDTTATGKYAVMQDTGGTNTLGQSATSELGELAMVLSGTDNEENWLGTGGNTGGGFKFIIPSVAVPHTIAFECRIKKSAIATGSMFVGFAEEGLVAADTMSDTGVFVDKDFIGFLTPETDLDGCDFAYNKESGANPTINNADVHTWVADTYVKLGFLYNYKNPTSRRIKVFVNGVVQSDYVTSTEIADTTNFPGGEEMALLVGGKVGATGVAHTITMDWWRAAQVVNG